VGDRLEPRVGSHGLEIFPQFGRPNKDESCDPRFGERTKSRRLAHQYTGPRSLTACSLILRLYKLSPLLIGYRSAPGSPPEDC
jgi:hypothetical protein